MDQSHGTWGNRVRIFQNDSCLVTVLYLEPKKRCSWHVHETAYNKFFVVRGKLGVKTDRGYTTWMTDGQSFDVEPGVYHEFQTSDDFTVICEVAYTKYNENDIKRHSVGGDLA